MKNYQSFLSENFHFLEVKFSLYLNRRVFVMAQTDLCLRWAHMSEGTFPHVAPHVCIFNLYHSLLYA